MFAGFSRAVLANMPDNSTFAGLVPQHHVCAGTIFQRKFTSDPTHSNLSGGLAPAKRSANGFEDATGEKRVRLSKGYDYATRLPLGRLCFVSHGLVAP